MSETKKKTEMEGDSVLRRLSSRTSRELSPSPTLKERIKSLESKSKTKPKLTAVDDARYIVRGVLNVGPPSPAGSSSSSGSGGYGGTSGSSAYRAKLLR